MLCILIYFFFSKFLWVKPMKSVNGLSTKDCLESIFREIEILPEIIISDG